MLCVLLPYHTYKNAQITFANPSQWPTANLDYSYNNNLHQTPADTCSSVPLPDSDYCGLCLCLSLRLAGRISIRNSPILIRADSIWMKMCLMAAAMIMITSQTALILVVMMTALCIGSSLMRPAVIIVIFETVVKDAVSIIQDKSAVPNFLKRFIITPPCNCKMKCSPI